MSRPVANWRVQVDSTPVFFDIVDESLRIYGPRAAWRALSRRDVGQKKAIFNGVVDLGYEQPELQALVTALPGKRIAPLTISGVGQEPELNIGIDAPHTGQLVVLNTLPFPQYRLAITVDLDAADADALIQSIQDGWVAKSLLKGKFSGSADGVNAQGGYKAVIDVKTCIADILISEGQRELSTGKAWQAINASIKKNQRTWLVYYGAAEAQGERSLAEAALAGVLYERCFDQVVVTRYDNGIVAPAQRLRDRSTMGDSEARTFVLTTPTKVIVDLIF